jgi:hypothetical protein
VPNNSFCDHLPLKFVLTLLLGDIWMLHDKNNMEANHIFNVNVGTFTNHEQSTFFFLIVNNTGIVWPTVQHDLIVKVSLIFDPGVYLRQRSVAVLSLEKCPMYS